MDIHSSGLGKTGGQFDYAGLSQGEQSELQTLLQEVEKTLTEQGLSDAQIKDVLNNLEKMLQDEINNAHGQFDQIEKNYQTNISQIESNYKTIIANDQNLVDEWKANLARDEKNRDSNPSFYDKQIKKDQQQISDAENKLKQDQSNEKKQLKQAKVDTLIHLNDLLSQCKDECKQKILQVLTAGPHPLVSPHMANLDSFLDQVLQLLMDFNPSLKAVFNAKPITDPTAPFPSSDQPSKPVPVNPVNPVNPPSPNQPVVGPTRIFHITVPSGKDPSQVYVRLQGIDPQTGQQCFVIFDKNGNPEYVEKDPQTGKWAILIQGKNGRSYQDLPDDKQTPESFCMKLSDLPKDASGQITVKMPYITSGRMLLSLDHPLYSLNPDPTNPKSPDFKTHWILGEMTINAQGTWFDYSAVDSQDSAFSMGFGVDKIDRGYDQNLQQLFKQIEALLKQYGGQDNSVWNQLFQKDDQGHIMRILSPKHFSALFAHYFDHYLQTVFLKHYQSHPLYIQEPINGKNVILKGEVSADGSTWNFYDPQGKLVTTLPTQGNNSLAYLTGSPQDFQLPGATSIQKDLMRDLSAIVNTGMKPSDLDKANTPSDPLCKDFFTSHKNLFYQATDQGQPMYNVYDRAMHEAGFHSYAYDYDDMLGQDGTVHMEKGDSRPISIQLDF